ncbi:G-protein subunit alpha 3 [Dictyostelium purpureum]|uniref:G-protein subunit alpha 3 n=1 Tax=Dictyostelium purpureum TaxID=5786 RepID=F1A4F4_DICPU|nr:G-protein subunit alpha 3 [Dictyostelium purpureum]EGC28923.1 G-protein subunit alpha 3 [Dictyostelium purpureum]|eukprot:XP_003294548.1 G-protein subunit alpha 3 [Dictyostelium purpureum]
MDYSNPPPQRDIIRAYLSKKGHVVKNWKLRLFVLKPGSSYMEYFVDETKEDLRQPQGRVPLFGARVMEYIHTGSGSNSNTREFCLIVETDHKNWIISASSKAQQVEWIEAIKCAIEQAVETDDIKMQKHRAIEKQLSEDNKKRTKTPVLKLLLLGAGESGKSTVVKQMKILHHKGFSKEEEDFYRNLIYVNLLDGVALLIHVIKENNIEVSQETESAIKNFSSWYRVYVEKRKNVVKNSNGSTSIIQSNLQNIDKKMTHLSLDGSTSINSASSAGNGSTSNSHNRSNSDGASNNIFNVQDFGLPPIITNYISVIWSDPVVQSDVMLQAQKYHINESTKYYLNELKRIGKPSYQPVNLDILKSRATTNGVVETDFNVGEVIFRIVDVAGQRGERKKWINFFDDVTAIVFVAAINEYDQKLVEDNCTNRLHESLNLFDQICNDSTFPKSSIILFLNKIDLFREKLKRTSIKICFPDYNDDQSYEKSSSFIKNSFLSKKRGGSNPGMSSTGFIYFHFTCATDTKSFETVFNSVRDIIISKTLEFYC